MKAINGMKICSKCREEKPVSAFHKSKGRCDGLDMQCKECKRQYQDKNKDLIKIRYSLWREKNKDRESAKRHIIYEENKDAILKKQHEYYEENKESVQKRNNQYYINNKEKIDEKRKQWAENNKDRLHEYGKKWREENKERKSKHDREWPLNNRWRINKRRYDRYNNDVQYKLSSLLRTRLRDVLNGRIKSGSSVRDLGCSLTELKEHIESMFKEGMSWENHGKYGWHIDHMLPLSSFDLTDREQLLIACNYKNLQPLWAFENLSKGATV